MTRVSQGSKTHRFVSCVARGPERERDAPETANTAVQQVAPHREHAETLVDSNRRRRKASDDSQGTLGLPTRNAAPRPPSLSEFDSQEARMSGDNEGGDANRPLTPREGEFVRQYVANKSNGTQAAIAAGYGEAGAGVQATRLLKRANVQAAIAKHEAKAERIAAVDRAWVLARLKENAERAMQHEAVRDHEGNETGEYTYQGNVANRALELLGKDIGMFKDQLEHSADEKLQDAVTRLAEARAKRQARE